MQGKQNLAVEREKKARARVGPAKHAAERRLVESMNAAAVPDLSGDADVTKPDLSSGRSQ